MRRTPPPRVRSIRDAGALQALCHPTRVEMLEALREPASAAGIARRLGQPRQRVNHHLRALRDAGLVERVGRRRRGNFVETLYRAAARSFVVSPEVVWADPRRVEVLRREHALRTLVALGERLQRDAVALLDRATFEGAEIASAAVSAEARFATEAQRAEFLREYLATTRELLDRYAAGEGEAYRLVLAVHPEIEGSPT
jgi:DNA-binding transcriptional ArsR family regulator